MTSLSTQSKEQTMQTASSSANHIIVNVNSDCNTNSNNITSRYRKNGFQAPLACPQIGIWMCALVMFVLFWMVNMTAFPQLAENQSKLKLENNITYQDVPLLMNIAFYGSVTGYNIAFVVGLLLMIRISVLDPGFGINEPKDDDKTAGEQMKSSKGPHVTFSKDHDKHFCFWCQKTRQQGTKHCRQCDKCVAGFDHHCPFLNQCIGEKNYTLFRLLVVIVSIACIIHVLNGFYLALAGGSHREFIKASIEQHGRFSYKTFKQLIALSIAFPFLFTLMFMQLTGYHIFLSCFNLTTYEHVMKRRMKKYQRFMEKKNQSTKESVRSDDMNVNVDESKTDTVAIPMTPLENVATDSKANAEPDSERMKFAVQENEMKSVSEENKVDVTKT